MRARRWGGGLVAAVVTALLLALVPAAAARAAGTGEQNWCSLQGIASDEAHRAADAACQEWRNRTLYTWGGGHGPAPGASYGTIDIHDLEETWNDPYTRGFDCSGFVRWAWYKAVGWDILGGGTAKSMYQSAGRTYQAVHGSGGGKPAVSDLEPGDIVFTGVGGTVDSISHVMLYLGGGYVVEAYQSQHPVRVIDINARIDNNRLVGVARMPQGSPFTEPPGYDGSLQVTWGTDVAVRQHPNKAAALVTRLSGPDLVYATCQQHGETVTAEGYTNDAWTYLSNRGGWISNIYLRGPAWLPEVPACTGSAYDPQTGSGGGGDISQGGAYSTWGTGVAVRSEPSTTTGTTVARLAGPTSVAVSCQTHAQTVTSEGYTNDAWSYLPQYGGWVTNIYMRGDAWLAGVPACDGKGTSTPAGASPYGTWGTGVAVHAYPATGSAVVVRLAGPTNVAVSCQKHAESVTAEGYTNDAWSYLPEYQGWISNIYMRGDAWLSGVPSCGAPGGAI
ncbi:NlpC/P60 family protein [Streptomyces sp. PA03-1a]|nr:NlpC/P60 family protein [Streptomyces sp. PA03-1a]MDX2812937.1 NlpC/P60 family protein [Streptomyces sp. PA03-5A]